MQIRTRLLTGILLITASVTVVACGGSGPGPGQPSASAGPAAVGTSAAPDQSGRVVPLIVGHRGAPGYRPEHTLASYELAARMGADYIEADVVPTKDGVLVNRHEPEIGGTTDVASHPEFASRKTTKNLDGTQTTGWFTEDFTLAELKTLKAVERLPDVRQHNTMYNGLYQVPTLQEYLDLAKRLSGELHRQVGVYIETKHPTFFRAQGIDVDKMLVDTLNQNGLNTPDAKVFIESFETNLRALHDQLKVPLVQLIDSTGAPADWVAAGDKRTYADMIKPAGLAEVAKYAQAIGPDKTLIIPTDPAGNPGPATTLVTDAHQVGLKLHPYTFRNENQFLPADLRSSANPDDYGKAMAEDIRFFQLGVDGIFTDNTDTGLVARAEYLATHK
ncbi:MAG TPA: glycerophosphodiester phosphodiesterase [Pseudonocardia sp.]|uniref:glycerophosphodiester phosphodiesterase n=1 Tax=Pseudonocardia sp. TaxID=60912 RepID=UPI002CB87F84|nr:glycerophosphodiester phosphodiesterase [Pseudonocardia sp.]HTF46146.1 glycerophosphodiester phosphodiesterase [Pseudonocardia sp.]